MKTAIYIEDGVVQLVITPEGEFEKAALRSFENTPFEAKIHVGTFYDCSGGWTRWQRTYSSGYNDHEDRSLILRLQNKFEIPERP